VRCIPAMLRPPLVKEKMHDKDMSEIPESIRGEDA
jgi:hypothetical protein